MKTARVHEYGGPDAIRIDELPRPLPPPGHVLIVVKAAGINFFDTQLRSGLYRRFSLPIALGLEGAGVVERSEERRVGKECRSRGSTDSGKESEKREERIE